ncbi:unnamed protein product [Leuciscus chuanchicus]
MFDSIKLGKLCKTHISPSVQAVPRPVCMMKFASHRRCYMWKSEAAPLPLPGLPWRFGASGSVIAETVGNEIKYPYLTEIFRDRLLLDHQTGSLTIKNMRIKHSGFYQLEINHNSGTSRMTFNVTVYDSPSVIDVEMKSVKKGDSVTLQTDVTEPHGDELIVWRFGDEEKLIAECDIETKSSPLYNDIDERFRDRLQLDHQTGSLTITDIRTTDSELFMVKISSSKQTLYKRFKLTISDSALSPGAVAGICGGVLLLLAAAAFVFVYNRHKGKCKKSWRAVMVAVHMSWGPSELVGLKVGCGGVTSGTSTSFHLSSDVLVDISALIPVLALPRPLALGVLLAEPLLEGEGRGSSPDEVLSSCPSVYG